MTIEEIKIHMRNDLNFLKSKNFNQKKIANRELFYNAICEKLDETSINDLLYDFKSDGESYGYSVEDYILYPVWIKKTKDNRIEKLKQQKP